MKENITTRICVPVCVKRVCEIAPAMSRATEVGDIIEVRLDCLTEVEFHKVEHDLAKLFKECTRPLIYTFRPAEQGGQRELNQSTRGGFWFSSISILLHGNANYADVEVDVADALMRGEPYLTTINWERVICSYHDFVGVSSDLIEIYERMAATRARILKIAVLADDITDCLPLLALLERARSEGREMIAIAMGEAGILTRILSPARGGYLTYGSLDDEQATAPGQIKATELRDLYRLKCLDEETEIMGLVGRPVSHSVSPQIHNAAFAASNTNAVYIPFEVRDVDDLMRRMVQPSTREIDWHLRGLSITAPHKQSVMRHLDWIDPIAQEVGAVNTILVEGEGLYGYNTDAKASLAPLQGLINLQGASVAIIGAGGAARAMLWSLREAGARVTVFARDTERAEKTAQAFGAKYAQLEGAKFDKFELVVNATPLGTRGQSEDETPAIASQLSGTSIAYDLIYNPRQTRFMREAQEAGCYSLGGLEMLIAQAAAQFKLWTNREAPLEAMRSAAEQAMMIEQ